VRTADGVVVEASVVARLFGLRLLSVNASVVVSPARVRGRMRAGPIGTRLLTAERLIDEGAASLAASHVVARSAPASTNQPPVRRPTLTRGR
jgi:hypothetical protein